MGIIYSFTQSPIKEPWPQPTRFLIVSQMNWTLVSMFCTLMGSAPDFETGSRKHYQFLYFFLSLPLSVYIYDSDYRHSQRCTTFFPFGTYSRLIRCTDIQLFLLYICTYIKVQINIYRYICIICIPMHTIDIGRSTSLPYQLSQGGRASPASAGQLQCSSTWTEAGRCEHLRGVAGENWRWAMDFFKSIIWEFPEIGVPLNHPF